MLWNSEQLKPISCHFTFKLRKKARQNILHAKLNKTTPSVFFPSYNAMGRLGEKGMAFKLDFWYQHEVGVILYYSTPTEKTCAVFSPLYNPENHSKGSMVCPWRRGMAKEVKRANRASEAKPKMLLWTHGTFRCYPQMLQCFASTKIYCTWVKRPMTRTVSEYRNSKGSHGNSEGPAPSIMFFWLHFAGGDEMMFSLEHVGSHRKNHWWAFKIFNTKETVWLITSGHSSWHLGFFCSDQ